VVAGILRTDPDGTVQRELQTVGPRTGDVLALNDWLRAQTAQQVTQVALESTGV